MHLFLCILPSVTMNIYEHLYNKCITTTCSTVGLFYSRNSFLLWYNSCSLNHNPGWLCKDTRWDMKSTLSLFRFVPSVSYNHIHHFLLYHIITCLHLSNYQSTLLSTYFQYIGYCMHYPSWKHSKIYQPFLRKVIFGSSSSVP